MSFFRNLRSSLTRGRSSSRDTTPVRNSRSGSVISSFNSGSSKRRDSIESRSDSLLHRSETFILDEPNATPGHSNCSTLEKKSKKSKVLEKFSTFTKRKKNPPSDSAAYEHHPSDNATNTYYKWQAEGGGNSLDYDSQNDPFNFLYEQPPNSKSLHNNEDSIKAINSPSPKSFDSSTYRTGKMPADLKKQLKMLKEQDLDKRENVIKHKHQQLDNEQEEDEEEEDSKEEQVLNSDKYKTVTLNSFRRSFREKFLQQQKEAAHNPAWFVEVETPEKLKSKQDQRDTSKENRRELLIFENENYRPGSKSPVRDYNNHKEKRSTTRSPVKRNDTFKVERLSRLDGQPNKTQPQEHTASIHIEFKNSITPHIPGRMVPVGVAKPMPSQLTYNNYYRKSEPANLNNSYTSKSYAGISTTRLNNDSTTKIFGLNAQTPTRITNTNTNNPIRLGRYQTLVQIKNDKSQQASSPITVRNSRLSTRIQLGGNTSSNPDKKPGITSHSPAYGKRFNSSQLISVSGTKVQPLKQTYFGDSPQTTTTITQIPSHLSSSSTSGLRTRQARSSNYGSYKYQKPSLFASTNSLTPATTATTTTTLTTSPRTTPSHSINNIHSSSSNSNNNNLSYLKFYQNQQQQQQPMQQQQQPQARFLVTGQRRSRSPIKVPWR